MNKKRTVETIALALRRFVIELLVSSFQATESVGVNATDLGCLCLLILNGPSPAGWLAEQTGLTTGAVTGVIDRLEGAGLARRQTDPGDRRRVIVVPDAARVERDLLPHFEKLEPAGQLSFYGRYTADQLTAIADFLSRLTTRR